MKVRLLPLFLMLLSVFAIRAQDNVIDEIVWVVGDEPILRSEVEAIRLQSQYQGVKFDGDPYCVIPEQIAIQKLFLHQADLDSLTVSDTELMSMVDRQINNDILQIGSKERLEESYGKPISKIREMYREQAKEKELAEMVKRKLIGGITVTPAEVRQFLSRLPLDSIPMVDAECEVELITVEPQYSPSEVADIKERLRGFTDRINAGSSFSTLAILYSQDRESAKAGGELGFMDRKILFPEFANVAFALSDPTKVSKIVQTDDGFHIIQLIEKRGDRINCRHILLKPEITASERNAALSHLDSIVDLIHSQKLTFNQAAQVFSFDKDTRNNGGLMVNPENRTSRFNISELPPEISKLIYNMNVGDISKPFTMVTEKGKEICAIVRARTKTKAHRANISDDFQLLKQIVQESKSEQIIENWIREKQRKTYVRINEHWSNCTFKYPGWIQK
jgi:peptidyl-prolyl cis-trans isomerase SurA